MEKKTKRKPTGAAALGAGPGRPKGVPNKTTTALKEAILDAAENVGRDGRGSDGLVGYLEGLAKDEPKAFSSLLGKVLPMQVANADGEAFKTQNEWTIKLVRPDART